ncbi:MAG: hypothetical protein ABIH66_01430, partial [bacterium]
MNEKLRLIKGEGCEENDAPKKATDKEMLKHLKAVITSMTRDAQTVWAEILEELEVTVGSGVVISPEADEEGFKPSCGWAEFMEKFWLLKHYLDH